VKRCSHSKGVSRRTHDRLVGIRTSPPARLIMAFLYQTINSLQSPNIHLPNTLPSNLHTHKQHISQTQTNPPTHQPTTPNTMASAMYRPSLTRSIDSTNASISSKRSSVSSTRAVYTRDSQGFFDLPYPASAPSTESEALVGRPAFTRAEYSKDSRGVAVDFAKSYNFSTQQTASSGTPFTRAVYSKDGRGMGIDFSASYRGRK
jgi:hypothetical protein